MKSLIRSTVLLIALAVFMVTLSACEMDLSPYASNDNEIDTIDVKTSGMQNAYVLEDFEVSIIQLKITLDDASEDYIPIKKSYLNDESLDALESVGTKTLEGTYKGNPFSFEITLVDDNRALLLHTIHTLGVQDASLDEDYETWVESIEGVSVGDAYINQSDELVFELSDGTTINVGTIPVNEQSLQETLVKSVRLENNSDLIFTYTDGTEQTITLDLSGQTGSGSEEVITMIKDIERAIVGVNNINSTGGGTGSGVIYKDNGDGSYNMITNHHVIENYESLQVVYEYYNNYYIVEDANITVLGSYAETDTAVLRFTPSHSVDTITMADSNNLKSGERVYALGSPQGQTYVSSVTEGIVAAPMRPMTGYDAIFVQHDAAISPGNSGGALVNAQGELIGMNTLKLSGEDVEGMGFAVKSNTLSRMIQDIEEDGIVTRATLGVSMSDPSQCSAEYGACISSVTSGSTADALGLQVNDSVIAYKTEFMSEYREIYNQNYLYESVLNTLVGTSITIKYERSGNEITSDPVIID